MKADDLFNEACRDLPEGWQIEIQLEQGCGTVELTNPSGDVVPHPSHELSLEEEIVMAIDTAKLEDAASK